MSHHNRLRRGFTLVELLVVMSLIAILATLAIMFFPNAASSQIEARAATQLQSALTIAKQRALRDQAPRGVRLWYNSNYLVGASTTPLPSVVTDLQYIEQPPDYPGIASVTIMNGVPANVATGYNLPSCVMFMPAGNMTGNSGVLVNSLLPLNPVQTEFWTVQPGDNLEVLNTGLMHQIVQIGVPDTKGNVWPDYVVISPPLPYFIGGTATFRVVRAPRVTGDETVKMPDSTVIDLNTNATFGNPLPPISTTYAADNGVSTGFIDILFSPTGEVISAGVTNSNINLWVRSPNIDNPGDVYRGAPTIISVFTKTGFVGAYPPASGTPLTPYVLIK